MTLRWGSRLAGPSSFVGWRNKNPNACGKHSWLNLPLHRPSYDKRTSPLTSLPTFHRCLPPRFWEVHQKAGPKRSDTKLLKIQRTRAPRNLSERGIWSYEPCSYPSKSWPHIPVLFSSKPSKNEKRVFNRIGLLSIRPGSVRRLTGEEGSCWGKFLPGALPNSRQGRAANTMETKASGTQPALDT